jgi:hypothetical protein
VCPYSGFCVSARLVRESARHSLYTLKKDGIRDLDKVFFNVIVIDVAVEGEGGPPRMPRRLRSLFGQHFPCNDQFLHLSGSLVNAQGADVAIELFHHGARGHPAGAK